MKAHNQKGFGYVGILLAVVLAAAVGFAGWWVWHNHHKSAQTPSNSSNVAVEPTVNYQLDVTKIASESGFINYTAKDGNDKEYSIHLFTDKNACDDQAIVAPKNVKVGDEVLVKGQVNPAGYIEVCTAGSYLKLAASFMVIKEWGVKVPVSNIKGVLSNSIKGLSYTLDKYSSTWGQVAAFRSADLNAVTIKDCNGSNSVLIARGTANQYVPNEINRQTAKDTYKAMYDSEAGGTNASLKIGDYYFVRPGVPNAPCTTDANQEAHTKAVEYINASINKMTAE